MYRKFQPKYEFRIEIPIEKLFRCRSWTKNAREKEEKKKLKRITKNVSYPVKHVNFFKGNVYKQKVFIAHF